VKLASFKMPSAKSLRIDRLAKGKRFLEAEDLRKLIDAAKVPLKAQILLGLNCGFGCTDVASLPNWALNLKAGIVSFPRPKTGVERRAFLWPETIAALKDAIAERPDPIEAADAELVFLTRFGRRFVRANPQGHPIDKVSDAFKKLLRDADIECRGSFYVLRHVFETIAGASRDQVAVNHIAGHVDSSMAGAYREHIDDERLKAVTDHVHKWLFLEPDAAKKTE
jgi:integrase